MCLVLRHVLKRFVASLSVCNATVLSCNLHIDLKLAFLSHDNTQCASQAATCVPALAKPSPSNKEVDDNTSALVQGLLAKSKANKDRYTKERLNDYYRRNFKVCSTGCLLSCPAACLVHVGSHHGGCRVSIDIEVHGGHCVFFCSRQLIHAKSYLCSDV